MKEGHYDHLAIEAKWQKYWDREKLFTAKTGAKAPKAYTLDMFAYPSGDGLHVGHPRGYIATDIFARYYRMRGMNVLRPVGWDAFGLPAENYAIKVGKPPAETTKENIKRFTKQLKSLGFVYDWEREINTSEPEYYKWTQWLFKVLYDNGYAYQKEAYANWCPSCQTVLANEQVANGRCERCDTLVEQKLLKQWFFKITDFADELISGLDKVDWPESTKVGQRNWIGRSEGASLKFQIPNSKFQIEVFTTRADTMFGATYLVLAPEHPVIKNEKLKIKNLEEVAQYIETTKKKSELERQIQKEKTGVQLEGVTAVNPATGKEIPIWVADYVLMDYGTGAIMAVPAHDERDFEFAKKFDLPVERVIKGGELPSTGHGQLINSGEFSGRNSMAAAADMAKQFGGKMQIQYKLHDWLISRQRYWGAPIPIIYKKGQPMLVEEKDLPVMLPTDVDFKPTGQSPLLGSKEFQKDVEKKYGKGARRELDTMDTFVCSSWYFLRYCDPHNEKEFADKKSLKYWMPVDLYIGGAEHTNGHLLYARFITKVLHKLGYLNFDEPFLKLRHQGLILAPDGEKMSKSRGNVINPDDLIAKYGADTLRVYEMFMGPFDQTVAWDTNGVTGVRKFLERAYKLVQERKSALASEDSSVHRLVKKVTEDIEEMKFNTVVSGMMEFVNDMSRVKDGGWTESFVKVLAPFAPHLAEEMWQKILGKQKSVFASTWPTFDPSKIAHTTVVIVVQEKGKLRGTVNLPAGASKDEVLTAVMQDERLAKIAKMASREVFVPDKIINFV
ncbi:TPA: leucine--tRNA ligase [Patescibacteria group bacterium]|uniref:Leucine--tRNA ligase n=2 Tax=Bacteria division Kazan-3B-28 TaxID=1798534 RepID=A0A0G1X7T8_UNCK3|nr:MAG: leucyl-tRNA synthetase, leucyl-tRNA synthetase [candidate division Kazan bacterium GW2011_GWA1_50_15]KKW25737.1 MAG: Leucine-tRNA ligase [candidate division Kazan bacterium GW2011_GWC1_52_13]KKW27248.1 MAG: Leucine-tRNA ligase [candidate division Kazan bacterium GW2011_GWB1_52_7]HAV65974.1 leucine--tRNA ligase [Patescibacteria group bacterium]HCL47538.1 leucine--tRNA ligase [Patescibacteria group bacterium]